MKNLILIAVMSISFSGAAFAAEAPNVKVGYSADSSMETEAGAMNALSTPCRARNGARWISAEKI